MLSWCELFVTGGNSGCRYDKVRIDFATTYNFVISHPRLVMPIVQSQRVYWLIVFCWRQKRHRKTFVVVYLSSSIILVVCLFSTIGYNHVIYYNTYFAAAKRVMETMSVLCYIRFLNHWRSHWWHLIADEYGVQFILAVLSVSCQCPQHRVCREIQLARYN